MVPKRALRNDIYVNSFSLHSVLNIVASDVRKWQPTLVFLSEKCRGQRRLVGHSPQVAESGTTEHTCKQAVQPYTGLHLGGGA